MWSAVAFLATVSAATPTAIDAGCAPIVQQLQRAVAAGALDRRVAVFVEEHDQCGAGGAIPSVHPVPGVLSGRALVEWVLDDVAQATNRPRYQLWSRADDVWLVAPPEGASRLDRWVRVDAAQSPTLDAALESVAAQTRDSGLPCFELLGAGLVRRVVGDDLDLVDPVNAVTTEGPLLEVLRALHAPHEGSLVGYFVRPGAFFPLAAPSVPNDRKTASHLMVSTNHRGEDDHVWRNRTTGAMTQAFRRPSAGWESADDVIQQAQDGTRFWVEDRGPAGPPLPSTNERPPAYPFDEARPN